MFIQPDWFEVTKPGVGTNRYAYSFNDPVNLRDPEGNAVPVIFGIAVAAYKAYSAADTVATAAETTVQVINGEKTIGEP